MLELQIIDGLRPDVMVARAKSFGVQGGVLGRDAACDWVLSDRQKVISGQHAKIIYSQGAYFLSDISTNGIVDKAGKALVKGEPRRLNLHDVFVIGPYRIEVVNITAGSDGIAQHQDLERLFEVDERTPVLTPLEYAQKSEVAAPEFSDFNFEVPDERLKAYDFMPEPLDLVLNVKSTAVQDRLERTAFVAERSVEPSQVNNFQVSVEVAHVANSAPPELFTKLFEAFGVDPRLFSGLAPEVLQDKLVTLVQELLRLSLDVRALLQSFQKTMKVRDQGPLEQHNPFSVAVSGRQLFELLLRQDPEFMEASAALTDFKKQVHSVKNFLDVLPLVQQQLLVQLDPNNFIKATHKFNWLSEKQAWTLFQQHYQNLTQHEAEAWLQQLRQLVSEKI